MGNLMLDFHAHVLPGVDHGSDSVETSLFQLSEAKRHGIKHIFATSHFYPSLHNADEFLKIRNQAYAGLAEQLDDSYPQLHLGAEVLLCDGLDTMPGLSELIIEDTNTLLLELPFADFSPSYADTVYTLVRGGIDVVLAHAERYREENIDLLIQNGARLQINASTLSGMFIPKRVKDWLASGVIVGIGTDIHKRDSKAYGQFIKASRRICKYLEPMTRYESNLNK
jgi:protein-tyrosine phosphatase